VDLHLIIQILNLFGIAIIGFFIIVKRADIFSYLKEKGKNLATKEDIAIITREMESVKLDHVKATHVHKLQFETEFQAFKEIWEKLLSLRNATLSLRPIVDTLTSSKEEKEERKKKRLHDFSTTFYAFRDTAENNKPFYPIVLWTELDELIKLVYKEAVGYSYGDPIEDFKSYWKDSQENFNQIIQKVDKICEVIRDRIDKLKSV
jgi:hypothetical protein